jgi:hypothetical protein
MDFPAWATLIRDRLRSKIHDVVATKAPNRATFRYKGYSATLSVEGDTTWVHFTNDSGPPMPSIRIAERTELNAGMLAKTIAGYFNAELSRPDR